MNNATGIFRVPANGLYYFSITGFKKSIEEETTIHLKRIHNGYEMLLAVAHVNTSQFKANGNGLFPIYAMQVAYINAENSIFLQIYGSLGAANDSEIHQDSLTFTGFLIQTGEWPVYRTKK